MNEIWVIEARFKVTTTDAESGWIPQSGLSCGSQEEAERMVEHYKKRNTLSEWRARLYIPAIGAAWNLRSEAGKETR